MRQPAAWKPRANPPAPQNRSSTSGGASAIKRSSVDRGPGPLPWEQNLEGRPLASSVDYRADAAAMRLHHLAGDCQPHAPTAFLAGEQRLKDTANDIGGDSRPVV